MKENSIEEAKRIIEKLISTMKSDREMFDEKTTEKEISTFFINALEFILSDYKRVLKENEELKQDRNNNYQMIALAQNEALGYMQGYEDGKKLKKSAIANIVENQQYYIFNEQIEYYKEYIEKLQKENEKLKNIRYDTPYGTETIHLIPESDLIEINTQKYMIEVEPGKFVDLKQVYQENKKLNEYKENYIPKSKLKDIIDRIDYDIKKTKEIISKNTNIYASYRKNDYQIVRLRAMNTKSLDIKKRLQELLEKE